MAVGHVISQISWMGSLIVLAALLAPAALGTVTIAMVVVQVAWLVVGAGTRGHLVVTRQLTAERIGGAVVMSLTAGVLIAAAMTAVAAQLMRLLTPDGDPAVLRVLTVSIVFYGLSIVPLALLQREMRFKLHAACVGGAALLASVVAVVAALAGVGVWALVARQVIYQLLAATFAWVAARNLLPARPAARRSLLRVAMARRPQAMSFFSLALISFVAMNIDYVIVSRVTDVELLGTYALAFTLAFAPQTQFAWQVGKVLFPAAAATTDIEDVRRRSLKAIRLSALLLVPLIPGAVVLAPVALPALLGPEWNPMIVPFQILLIVGVSHAMLAILREFLLGSGHARFCASLEGLWLAAQLGALVLLVPAYGIRGAAAAHLVVLLPLAVAYAHLGARRLGIDPRDLGRSIARVGGPAAGQAPATVAAWLALAPVVPDLLAATGAALAGTVIFVALAARGRSSPLREGREVIAAAVSGRTPS